MMPTIPLSLYIHLPWCVQKCPYCDFNSHALKSTLPEEAYVQALLANLQQFHEGLKGRELTSIFFGGGTPSLFSGQAVATILNHVSTYFTMPSDIEITLEANPGAIDEKRFVDFRSAGINRLSLGVQSMQLDKLKALGRIHDVNDVHRALRTAKKAGFNNVNIDIMYGLPKQTLAEALSDIKTVLAYEPTHFSWYQLTIEPNTAFYHKPPSLPNDDKLDDMQQAGQGLIRAHGFYQYEVSAYSLPNNQCLHNRNYWEFGDYLGVGAGAHSKLTNSDENQIVRFMQMKHPKDYMQAEKRRDLHYQMIEEPERIFEFMLNALRLTQGVPTMLFTERTLLSLTNVTPMLNTACQQNLLSIANNYLCPTPLGKRFLNNLVSLFMPASKK